MTTRREFLIAGGAGLCALAPLASFAQEKGKVWRIGFFYNGARQSAIDTGRYPAFLQGMRELGYIEGKNFVIEARFAEAGEVQRLPSLAAELVRAPVDVIVSSGASAAQALKLATSTVPVTPEIHHPTRGREPYGEAARWANEALVSGRAVQLVLDVQPRDRYGRLLASVYVNGQLVNAELVRRGYAEVATYPPNVRHYTEFVELQRQARLAQQGLWGDAAALAAYQARTSGVIGVKNTRVYLHPPPIQAGRNATQTISCISRAPIKHARRVMSHPWTIHAIPLRKVGHSLGELKSSQPAAATLAVALPHHLQHQVVRLPRRQRAAALHMGLMSQYGATRRATGRTLPHTRGVRLAVGKCQ